MTCKCEFWNKEKKFCDVEQEYIDPSDGELCCMKRQGAIPLEVTADLRARITELEKRLQIGGEHACVICKSNYYERILHGNDYICTLCLGRKASELKAEVRELREELFNANHSESTDE